MLHGGKKLLQENFENNLFIVAVSLEKALSRNAIKMEEDMQCFSRVVATPCRMWNL